MVALVKVHVETTYTQYSETFIYLFIYLLEWKGVGMGKARGSLRNR